MLLTDSLNLTHENLLTLIDIVILADSNTCNGPYIQVIAIPPLPVSTILNTDSCLKYVNRVLESSVFAADCV